MIVEISIAIIAACSVLLLIRLYMLSIRFENTLRRFEEFMARVETDIRPILYETKNIMSDIRSIAEVAKSGSKKIDCIIEQLAVPFQTFGMIIKAIRVGINTLLKRGGEH